MYMKNEQYLTYTLQNHCEKHKKLSQKDIDNGFISSEFYLKVSKILKESYFSIYFSTTIAQK